MNSQKPEHSLGSFLCHIYRQCCSLTKLKSDPHISFMCFNKSSLKNGEKCFLFHVKSSICHSFFEAHKSPYSSLLSLVSFFLKIKSPSSKDFMVTSSPSPKPIFFKGTFFLSLNLKVIEK